jgi:hypothetical protein
MTARLGCEWQQVRSGHATTQAPAPHGRTLTQQGISIAGRPVGLPVTTPAAYHCAGKAHSMFGGSGHLVKSMHLGGFSSH